MLENGINKKMPFQNEVKIERQALIINWRVEGGERSKLGGEERERERKEGGREGRRDKMGELAHLSVSELKAVNTHKVWNSPKVVVGCKFQAVNGAGEGL